VVLEMRASFAASAVRSDVRTLTFVALPHRSPLRGRNVATVRGARARARTQPRARRELALLELGDQLVDRAVEQLRELSRRLPEQGLRIQDLLVRLLRDRDLQRDALRGERCELGTSGRWYHRRGRRRLNEWDYWPRGHLEREDFRRRRCRFAARPRPDGPRERGHVGLRESLREQ